MTEDRIELVDREYGQSVRAVPARQIKTRSTSFSNIRERYNKFRLKYLERKLEKKIESALTQGYTEENYERKITKNAEIIARIEEKILLLSKENVPQDYVAKRAIKLRKNMISNLTYNAGVMYTVGLENRDAVFGKEENEETIEPQVVEPAPIEEPKVVPMSPANEEIHDTSIPYDAVLAAAIPSDTSSDEIDVVPSDLERQAIVDVVNSSFDDIEVKENDTPDTVSSEEVKEVINESFDDIEKKEEAVVADSESSEVDKEAVREIIDEAFDAMNVEEHQDTNQSIPESNQPEAAPSISESEAVVEPVVDIPSAEPVSEGEIVSEPIVENESVTEPVVDTRSVDENRETAIRDEVDKAVEKIRVSRNNSAPVNSTQYDENGYRRERHKKYNYTPMTDEEIRESQIKLGFDEHGNLIDNGARPKETIESAKIVGSFIAPGSIPNLSLEDVFIPADKQIREVPVVVPDRDDSSLGLELEDGKSMFELIEQPSETPSTNAELNVASSDNGMTVEDFNELKKKIMFLQQQKQLTNKQKEEAQKAAQVAAQEAQEARRLYEVSQANYNERMEKLRAFTASLEADCSENVRSTEQAEDEARRSNDFVQTQRELADTNNRIIGEIDSMIGASTTTALKVR